MKAELEQFKNDIRTYDRDQLFSLCVELKEFSIRQSVFLKEYENSFPVMTKDYQNLKEKLKQKTEELSALQKKYQCVCDQNLLFFPFFLINQLTQPLNDILLSFNNLFLFSNAIRI